MRMGCITLLYKKGERSDLSNWRPITLLNVDYKILAKAITLRLRGVMASVVHPDQTCGVQGRTCALNLCLIRDVLSKAEEQNVPVALLSLDQEKAFDRTSHNFLFSVLERLNFGPLFVGLVKLLYEKAVSRVCVNGFLSRPVQQAGGVRQGCPFSPLLYLLTIEPLAASLRADRGLKGFHVPGGKGSKAFVSLYADDLNLFLTDEGDGESEGSLKFLLPGSWSSCKYLQVSGYGGWFVGRTVNRLGWLPNM